MKKTFSKSMAWLLSVVMMCGLFVLLSIPASATQSRKENFNKNYTVVSGNPGQTVANIAYAQVGKTGSDLGYTEDWCADFVSDCAELAGQSAAVPRHGRADYIDEYILNAGGWKVSAANAKPGDIAFYDFNGNNSPEHVEIVYSVSGSTVKTVGGNTGNNNLYYATVCSPRSPGSLLYIIRPNYNTQHTHSYTEYIYYWAAHPHYKCYKCSCGDVKENRNETVVLDTCNECLAEYKATLKLDKSSYLVGDSVTVSWNRVNNATHYNLWIYRVKSDGNSELVSRNDIIKDTKYTYSNLSAGRYYTYFQTYNSNYWMHDNSDWFHSQADRVYFEIKLPTYTVSYNMNGGSGSIASQTKSYGKDLTLSSTKPTRTGYTFIGWNTNASVTTAQYQPGGKYTANSGATLYAIWKINPPTEKPVISNLNKTYNVGKDLTFSWNTIDRASSYWVNVWYNPGGESTKIVDSSVTTTSYTLKNLTPGKYGIIIGAINGSGKTSSELYNFYVPYTIKYNVNGGTGTISPTYKLFDEECILSSTEPTRPGYTFVGWNTNKNATTAKYQPGGKYTANSSATLYAIWKINPPTEKPVISNLNKTYNVGKDLTFSWNTIDRASSYWVNVWYNPGGESTKIVDSSVTTTSYTLKNLTPGKYGIIIGAINGSGKTSSELYNFYVPYTIKYNVNGGTDTIPPTYKLLDVECNLTDTIPIRTGYDFVGWDTDKDAETAKYQAGGRYLANGDVTLYAIWKESPLTNTSTLSDERIRLGNNITVYASATGGAAPYQYAYVAQAPDGKWYVLKNYSTDSTHTWKPASTGKYTVQVKVKDSAGTVKIKSFTLNVSNELANNSTLSAAKITKGQSVTMTAKAVGGTAPYQYAYVVQSPSGTWTVLKGFGTATSHTWTPASLGNYTVQIKVKDSAGTVNIKSFTLNVSNELANTSTLSAAKITKGQGVSMTAKALGGTAPYQYAYVVKSPSGTWTVLKGFGTAASLTWKPASLGNYTVQIKVKDSAGTVKIKNFNLTVSA